MSSLAGADAGAVGGASTIFSVTAAAASPSATAVRTAGSFVDSPAAGGKVGDSLMASAYLRALPPDPMIGKNGRLFRGFQQRRFAGAELLKQGCFVGFCGSEMTLFDMTEAADFFRNGGKADGKVMIVRRKLCHNFLKHRLVVGDQPALGAALERPAERIERRSAQSFELRQRAKQRHDPRAEAHFARQAGRLVDACE